MKGANAYKDKSCDPGAFRNPDKPCGEEVSPRLMQQSQQALRVRVGHDAVPGMQQSQQALRVRAPPPTMGLCVSLSVSLTLSLTLTLIHGPRLNDHLNPDPSSPT